MNKSSKDNQVKVKFLILGESGVGKSSLLLRFTDNKFNNNFVMTLGVEYKQKQIEINSTNVIIQVWDTAGQERFKTITPIYYKSVDAVVIVYDICDQKSFEQINDWIENLKEHTDINNINMVLVGNKSDMQNERQVNKEDALKQSKIYNIEHFEASAKGNYNKI
ncbi:Ras family protein, putative [Ichthyophthirius multifiliis]|uniref:Ras family protein, putative n=1 Tax=Ichthyophthirius multifiliis TaxID=5932 RepID=G0R1E4_ICHMU|nr:Ras family protein, putative [Ichthyophthirius multifiliis]EGR28701.1 Ras family protein, putative [Ichthyophthirius multifiliis]|eukprot:XP_004029937.1 Ras family protein, putative [Ichthyophthirius multifiliis]